MANASDNQPDISTEDEISIYIFTDVPEYAVRLSVIILKDSADNFEQLSISFSKIQQII